MLRVNGLMVDLMAFTLPSPMTAWTTPLLNVVVARSNFRNVYIVAGLADPALLTEAANELLTPLDLQ